MFVWHTRAAVVGDAARALLFLCRALLLFSIFVFGVHAVGGHRAALKKGACVAEWGWGGGGARGQIPPDWKPVFVFVFVSRVAKNTAFLLCHHGAAIGDYLIKEYPKMVGTMIYIAITARPDVAHAVGY